VTASPHVKSLEIGYQSDTPMEYSRAIRRARTFTGLLRAVTKYRRVASDAFDLVSAMSAQDFADFQQHLPESGKPDGMPPLAWLERFSIVVMPDTMFRVSMIAAHFGAPWGCAFIRMKQDGLVVEEGGIARYVDTAAQRART